MTAIRARRHPGAILAMWAWQATFAIVGAYPAASLVGAAYGNDPRGDAALWSPGAHALLDLLSRDVHGAVAAAASAALVLSIASVAGLFPLAALMHALTAAPQRGPRAGSSGPLLGAISSGRAFGVLFACFTLIEALVLGAAVATGAIATALAQGWLGEARAQMVGIGAGIAWLAPACAIGVTHDLARAAAVRRGLRGLEASIAGVHAFRRAPVGLLLSWAIRAGGAVVPIGMVATIAGDLARRGATALLLLAGLHQGVAVLRVTLRASWLARALRAVDPAAP